MEDKQLKPPYATYRTFMGHIEELKNLDSHLPSVIDKSLLRKKSGTDQSALIATYKWFRLIDDAGKPTEIFQKLFSATDEESKRAVLEQLVRNTYDFVTDESFQLRTTTSNAMAERFRQYEISGSTLSRSISFFLGIAKDAGIPVSPHIKPPSAPVTTKKKKAASLATNWPQPSSGFVTEQTPDYEEEESETDGMVSIPIPIFGKPNAKVIIPSDLSDKEWSVFIKMSEFILKNYRDNGATT